MDLNITNSDIAYIVFALVAVIVAFMLIKKVAGCLIKAVIFAILVVRDVLVNDDSPMADKTLVNESLSKEIDRALSTLTDREKDIIRMFFGIGCREMTLEEIGDKFGLTRERVRQIKEKAIRRLRQNSRSKLLKSYLG